MVLVAAVAIFMSGDEEPVASAVSPTATATATPTPVPTATARPAPTATMMPTPVLATPVPTPTSTPTPMPTPVPTATLIPTPMPTATPLTMPTPTRVVPTVPAIDPALNTFCLDWEAMIVDWIREGNVFYRPTVNGPWAIGPGEPPVHPRLSLRQGTELCLTEFPRGILYWSYFRSGVAKVGDEPWQLLPGTYEYRRAGIDRRVEGHGCEVDFAGSPDSVLPSVRMTYGESFTFQFHAYHGHVLGSFGNACKGALYRIGD